MKLIVILLVLIGLPLLIGVVIYNRLVALRETRKNAFSDIDVQLQQRYDLIPNLIETVKGYASHEKEILENITKARAGISAAKDETTRLQAETMMDRALMSLFAVAENYPDLKAEGNFRALQAELSDIENKIAAARRYFNNATNELNTAVQQFPGNIIAGFFHFGQEGFYEIDADIAEQVRQRPDVKF